MSRGQRPIDEIAPPEFLREKWGTTDPEAAIQMAEAARTSSDPPHKRCPACRSRRVSRSASGSSAAVSSTSGYGGTSATRSLGSM